jgi:tetratricopeptide (TPR) repeat protein
MSNWRLGFYQAAVVDWTETCELIQAKSQQGLNFGSTPSTLFPGTSDDLEGSWCDWMIADLLMHECDELMAQSDHTLDSMSNSNNASKDTDAPLYRALGEWHAIRGEWEQAHNCFEYVHRLSQLHEGDRAVDYLHTALASLKLVDEPGFFRLRNQAISGFNSTTDAGSAEYVMKIALLRPASDISAAALEPFVQVLQRALASAGPIQEGVSPASWDAMLLGLSEYRRGNYAKAVDWCRRSLDTSKYVALPAATDRVILAMSFHKLGDDATAHSELSKARTLFQCGLDHGFDKWHWREWVFARLLLQEANGLIPQAPPPEPQK